MVSINIIVCGEDDVIVVPEEWEKYFEIREFEDYKELERYMDRIDHEI